MAKRLLHLVGFFIACVTITALAFALLSIRHRDNLEGSMIADPAFLTVLVWIGSIGGFICAAIIATKTAWSVYSWGRLRKIFERKVG